MGTVILTFASVGLVCAAGIGISSGLRWFHEYEIDLSKRGRKRKEIGGGEIESYTESIKNQLKHRG